jgi:putative two-component system response regulator
MERNGRVRNGQFKRVFTTVIVVGIALLVLSQFFGFYYAFDEQNRYYRKDSYGVMVVLLWLATIALLALTLANWKHYTLIERVSFVVLEVLPVIAMIAQLFTYGISLTTFASTISLLMLFMTYEVECSQVLVKNERKLLNEVISALAEAVDAKDTYTRGHSGRVAVYARMLAERMELTNQEIERVYRMALLHDVGKIGIPDAVLNKPGKLTDEEFALIKSHTVRGGDILGKVQSMPELSDGARWHHERFDGRGYPDGMRGEDIPLEARIICVADCYDAMTSDRVYRKHLSQEVVRREIEAYAGSQFDPQIARLMLEIIDEDKDYQLHE